MSFIKFSKNCVIIAFNRKIIFSKGEHSWTYDVSPNLPLEKSGPRKYFDADSDSEEDEDSKKQAKQQNQNGNVERVQIVAVEVHDGSRSLIAVATSDKSLHLFELIDSNGEEQLQLLSRRIVSRASSCMKFSNSGRFLIVCDKGGDCYKYDCEEYKKPGRWLLGHMSQVLDVLIDANESLIITSDRDEKIRVTNYPDSHNIETFCLGHTEFVSHLEFVAKGDDLKLMSLSGDKTVRLWDYRKGKELARKELAQPGSSLAIKKLDNANTLLAVLCCDPTTIAIYKINEDDAFRCDFVQELQAKTGQVFSAMAIDGELNLLALAIEKNTENVILSVYMFDLEKSQFSENDASPVSEHFAKHFRDSKLPYVDSVSFLFKKKFDNIKNYHERKRKRMEELKK